MKNNFPLGLSKEAWEAIEAKYGEKAEELVYTNPYELALSRDMSFETADDYVMEKTGASALCPKRLANALLYTLISVQTGVKARDESAFAEMIAGVAGSTCIPKSRAYDYIEALLGLEEGSVTMPMLNTAIKHLAITGKISENRIGDRVYLSTKRMFKAEKEAAIRVNELLSGKPIIGGSDIEVAEMYAAVDSAMAKTGMILSQEQKNAVCMVLRNRVSVLTGGPGTGKSATQKILVESLKILRPNAKIRCIAPTGMAAMRMNEATGCYATTIHSALKIIPGRVGDAVTLFEDLILVDESSMIDVGLCATLLKHISDQSTIVFIGDVAQLPSIAAGNVLKDLITSKVPVTELTKVFRQGDNSIAFNCAKIKNGNPSLEEDASFQIIEREGSEDIQDEVCRLYKQEVERSGIDAVCCLSPYRRKTKTGVNQLNTAIRKRLRGNEFHGYCEREDGMRIYTGDKITFLKNKDGLVNGDTGTAIKCYEGTCVCRFGDKELTLTGEDISSVEPSFAQTVHKAQGQEYKTVIVVCDDAHLGFLSRNLIYTSISRAKKKCICVGSRYALAKAITEEDSGPERTGALAGLIGSK